MSIENAISELKTLMGERLCISAAERKQYGQNETYYKENFCNRNSIQFNFEKLRSRIRKAKLKKVKKELYDN